MLIGVFTLVACSDDTESDSSEQAEDSPAEETNQEETEAEVIDDADVPSEVIETADAFLSALAAGEFEQSTENFSEMMNTELDAEEMEDLWNQLNEQLGDFIDYEYQQTQQVDEFYSLTYQGLFSGEEVNLEVAVDQDNQIVGFFVTPA